MALSQRLDLRQSQALVMTPQLQQAIKLLQLSNVELAAYVEGELEQNPLLELDDTPAEDSPEAAPTQAQPVAPGETTHEEAVDAWHEVAGSEGEGNLDYAGDPSAWKTSGPRPDGDDLPGLDQTLARP